MTAIGCGKLLLDHFIILNKTGLIQNNCLRSITHMIITILLVLIVAFVAAIMVFAKYASDSIKEEMPSAPPASLLYRDKFKRIIDLLIAVPVMLIVFIPMLITALAIKLDSPGPVLFKQERLGKGGKVFKILKFRSMCQNAEHTGTGVYSGKGDARVTRVGKFIRATSIDELPQLFNVIKGDMSLIGPRPPLTYHPWNIDEYTEEQIHMFDVRPGFSGWAQIHGRKEVEWNHRIELNNWYVQHVTFSLDVKIFLVTIIKVLLNEDNENTSETLKK